ncbi:prolipoprotein diacylglyceryl transferase [Lutibaculum baratangense]|uniref:Phosphatidylglycerol--prolipoprotein diacylglyceryl transferase n=1 Tax=Lutibaculum baratangense AMV1 TaxID=631454 RepID=V4RIU0_9HYPH|nr:prolipoprotein diacylglyceryl transferase [Lutibaculum baratangense]ESR23190.1 Prolipoprotein diacylglyceryl transferase [Lutibaculum baratangense AMV1]
MPIFVMPFPAIDPVAISIGPFAIRWYALAYVTALLFAWWYMLQLVKTDRLWSATPGASAPLQRRDVDDIIVWGTLGVVLGGRLGYVLFYNLPHYLQFPVEALAVWQGGMSFHGGFLGVAVALVLFTRARGIPLSALSDCAAAAAPAGLFLGRIANFINGELWGRPADVPWAVVFPFAGPEPRHPSQLYEAALEGLLLFAVLAACVWAYRSLSRPWLTTGLFLAGYGLGRTVSEFFREPDPQLGFLWGGLTMGMLLSIPMILVGLAVAAAALRRPPRPTAGSAYP